MSRINNCTFICCDRCSYGTYFASNIQLENSNWSLGTKVDEYAPMDLCPECAEKWHKLMRDFLDNVDIGEETE